MINQNLPKCRIVAEFFYETLIRAFFRGFQTNCTTRLSTNRRTSCYFTILFLANHLHFPHLTNVNYRLFLCGSCRGRRDKRGERNQGGGGRREEGGGVGRRERGWRKEQGAGNRVEGVFVIQAHRSIGSGSPCRRPACVFSIYFLTRSVLSQKFALTMPCVNIKYSF